MPGGEIRLTIRKLLWLFFSTLGWGSLAGLIVGTILISTNNEFVLWEVSSPGLNVMNVINIILAGATISVVSQMGFFSYLIFRYIIVGIIRKKRIWEYIQLILIAEGILFLTHLRYLFFDFPRSSWLEAITLPVILLVIAIAVSYWKVKMTKGSAFIPTLLFMFVVTLVEGIPALRLDSPPSYVFMLTPLIVCNAWQILKLHRIIRTE
ncbi:KinB signaling pathway activation protein [Paenibacillus psychroresistens]|uniref:KinB signaling pathway activation protein n=1 Tax=Paenibacillus psychroresistens TaxID=1778678 RepID=A0A6B8RDN2_9BACL|nr:KinB signaling pathway activation protein [Paenibacillus psychroresistens]